MIQKAQAGYRVDTGALKIDDDWPGLFIRGDHAMAMIQELPKELAEIVLRDVIVEQR